MHLMRRGQLPACADRLCRSRTQQAHVGAIARPAKAELVPPPGTAEEPVRHIAQQRVPLDLERGHVSLPDCG